jgi:hypothetical protein
MKWINAAIRGFVEMGSFSLALTPPSCEDDVRKKALIRYLYLDLGLPSLQKCLSYKSLCSDIPLYQQRNRLRRSR